ncbi:MAG: hypothetical protein ACFFAU_08010, partial [Candidatus Hodarchaeota archaeon]
MPTCSRCGSYYIRPPCPVCSPPGVKQLIEDSPFSKGKSIEELQKELENYQETVKNVGLEYETRIQELRTNLGSINGKISDLELSKVSSDDKKRSLEKLLSDLTSDYESLLETQTQLKGDRTSLLKDIESTEKKVEELNSEIINLKNQKERRQREEEERRQREEEERRQREEEERRQREEEER